MAYLVLVRHGESKWNAKGLWTGLTDIGLSQKGKEEAKKAAYPLKGIHFDLVFTSTLLRSKQTLEEMKPILNLNKTPIFEAQALNERDYGKLNGKNKWDIKKKFGEEQFLKWRRGWNSPIPGGETLKNVYDRVTPCYEKDILPALKKGKNVLMVAHNNSLRALIKYLENISDEDIPNLELKTGEIYLYRINQEGKILSKEIKNSQLT